MTEDQEKAADQLVKAIGEFWGPVIAEVVERTGWSSEQIWGYQVMASIQSMERGIDRLLAGYEKALQSQQEMKPKTDKLVDLSLKALEEQGDDWKEETDGLEP